VKISVFEYKQVAKKRTPLSETFLCYWNLLAPSDTPPPTQEHRFCERKWRFDCAWINLKVAVECDGMVWQAGGGRHNTDADRDKINTATLLGWRILRFSGAQIKKKPQECINMTVALIKNQVQSHV